ncbi:hypothetical protein NPIL_35381 [Nephila pilipes]|uniref:Uncharacterized protein n=1 Tax=Nephila pilipes TaxID=299642 RepID=A0A8X6Q2E7_NEPPI|nr:hypothetical protein NPIL_35381 [Nephila pilipes]
MFSSESKRRSANSFSGECVMRQDRGRAPRTAIPAPKHWTHRSEEIVSDTYPPKSPLTLSETRKHTRSHQLKNNELSGSEICSLIGIIVKIESNSCGFYKSIITLQDLKWLLKRLQPFLLYRVLNFIRHRPVNACGLKLLKLTFCLHVREGIQLRHDISRHYNRYMH